MKRSLADQIDRAAVRLRALARRCGIGPRYYLGPLIRLCALARWLRGGR